MEISVAQAKDQFSRCLSKAQAGETVTIRKHGKAIAQITGIPDKPKNNVKFGSGRGTVKVFGDLTEPAFDPDDWECL
jgi:antitoxin (DNA-binding transcriptional repressor) of toxin-antitoxin stability system